MLSLTFLLSVYEIKFLLKKKSQFFFIITLLLLLFVFSFYKARGVSNNDLYILIWVILIVWTTDIGGYVFGKFIGGPNFSKISPNKTIAGLFGSLIFSQFSFLFFNFLNINKLYSIKFFFLQFLFCIISIFGDLFFSYIKRQNKIKDYSRIIPGHGGILDRIDSMIFVIIFFYFSKFFYVY